MFKNFVKKDVYIISYLCITLCNSDTPFATLQNLKDYVFLFVVL